MLPPTTRQPDADGEARRHGPAANSARVRIGYLITGLIMGGMWALNAGEPLLARALKSLLVITTLTVLLHMSRSRRPRGANPADPPRISPPRQFASRAVLILLATVASLLLRPRVTDADDYIAAGMGLTVALLGPSVHRRLLVTQTPASPIRRTTVIAIAATSALVVLLAGEATVRHVIDSHITGAAQSSLTGSVHVGIGTTPALVDLARGSISTVSLTDDGMRTCKLSSLNLAAEFNHVTRQDGQIHFSGSQAAVTVPMSAIMSLLAQRAPQLGQATVEPGTANNDVTIALGPGGLIDIDEQVALHGGALQFTPKQVTFGGDPAAGLLIQRLAANATFTVDLPQLPLSIKPDSVAVDQEGVTLAAKGGAATLASTRITSKNACQ
jgi:hypothetical protein